MKLDRQDKTAISVVGILVMALFFIVGFAVGRETSPADINVKCIGDHLLFESSRTGDIQVIPNKCKKTYPRSQAPVTDGSR